MEFLFDAPVVADLVAAELRFVAVEAAPVLDPDGTTIAAHGWYDRSRGMWV